MCGIVGYVGPRGSESVLLGGLGRLEYRGYDSAGIAVIADSVSVRKRAGKLVALRDELKSNPIADGHTGIGHTRWATHGAPNDVNAHPHLADDGKLALIHNGIIENFAELKAELVAEGQTFESETDSEVAAHLVAREYRVTGNLTEALRHVVSRLHGAFTLLVIPLALLLLGFAGAFRPSELVGLDVADIEIGADGLRVQVRPSSDAQLGDAANTDVPRTQSPALCPVRALSKKACTAKLTILSGTTTSMRSLGTNSASYSTAP